MKRKRTIIIIIMWKMNQEIRIVSERKRMNATKIILQVMTDIEKRRRKKLKLWRTDENIRLHCMQQRISLTKCRKMASEKSTVFEKLYFISFYICTYISCSIWLAIWIALYFVCACVLKFVHPSFSLRLLCYIFYIYVEAYWSITSLKYWAH